jgi:hypothetical protein
VEKLKAKLKETIKNMEVFRDLQTTSYKIGLADGKILAYSECLRWLDKPPNQVNPTSSKPTNNCPECFDNMTVGNFCKNCGRALNR